MNINIKHFIYIDEDAVNSIYEQLLDEQIPVKITTTNYTGNSLDGGIKTDSLIGPDYTSEYWSEC